MSVNSFTAVIARCVAIRFGANPNVSPDKVQIRNWGRELISSEAPPDNRRNHSPEDPGHEKRQKHPPIPLHPWLLWILDALPVAAGFLELVIVVHAVTCIPFTAIH